MKKVTIILSFFGIFSFIVWQFGNKTTVAQGDSDLQTISVIFEAENIFIKEWSIHAREKLEAIESKQEMENYVDQMKKQFPEWAWTISHDSKHWEAAATSTNSNPQESIRIISTANQQHFQAYVIFEAKGTKWTKETEAYAETELPKRLANFSRGKTGIFSCIKGEFNDKIRKVLPNQVHGLLQAFNAKELEALREESFISVSAYSPIFNSSIKSKHENMNMQLAVRSQGMGKKTTVVVGTPIITIEY